MDAQSRKQNDGSGAATDRPDVPRQWTDPAIGGDWGRVQDPAADEHNARQWELHHPGAHDGFGHIRGFQRQGGSWAPSREHRGKTSSWVAVALAFVGFALGGVAVVMDWAVVPLVTGGVLLLIAVIIAFVYDILTDVVLDAPREASEEPHQTPLHRIRSLGRRGRTSEREDDREEG